MYWPLGAPRIYAASRRRRRPYDDGDKEEVNSERPESDRENILGLRISRSGRLFTTITESSLSVWQTSVWRHLERLHYF